jgi:hypothetical protein
MTRMRSKQKGRWGLPFAVMLLAVGALQASGPQQRFSDSMPQRQSSQEGILRIVAGIQRADYEGNRPALASLYEELGPFLDGGRIVSRVLYWRGFAMWRRALNGFNDGALPRDLEDDLTRCTADFRSALTRDPDFVEAKIGAASCLINHSFLLLKTDRTRAGQLFVQSRSLMDEAMAAAPDNPRLLWVYGANQWYSPASAGDGQAAALATYSRGLALARREKVEKGRAADPLEPSWGEAELLMNLAFANLNRSVPDVAAAERYALDALALVPHWHYVRDVLLLQIRRARR